MSNESLDAESQSILLDATEDYDEEPAIIETATMTRIINDKSVQPDPDPEPNLQPMPFSLRIEQTPGLRESVLTTAIREVESTIPNSSRFLLQPPPGKLGNGDRILERTGALESPMN